ncbi:MAG TPA: hypothetical protein VJ922_01460 [Actinomycetota bacterium]|nr:hypothetical protein [Actinomycetota bacterium]
MSATDLARAGTRTRGSDGADAARIQALEQRFDELLTGLERLVSSARGPVRRARRART